MADQWRYSVAGEKKGPVSSSELKQLASAGKLSRTDLIWKEGMTNWAPAGKVKGLFTSASPSPEASPPERVDQKLTDKEIIKPKIRTKKINYFLLGLLSGSILTFVLLSFVFKSASFFPTETLPLITSLNQKELQHKTVQNKSPGKTAPIRNAGIDEEIQSFKKFIKEKINSNKGTKGFFSGSPAAYLEIMSTINGVERCLHRDVNFEQKSELKLIGRDLTVPILGMAYGEKFQKGVASFTPEETHEYEVKQMALSEEFKSLHK